MKHFVLLVLVVLLAIATPCIASQITSHTYQLGLYNINVTAVDANYNDNISALYTGRDGVVAYAHKVEFEAENLQYMLIVSETFNESEPLSLLEHRDATMVVNGLASNIIVDQDEYFPFYYAEIPLSRTAILEVFADDWGPQHTKKELVEMEGQFYSFLGSMRISLNLPEQ